MRSTPRASKPFAASLQRGSPPPVPTTPEPEIIQCPTPAAPSAEQIRRRAHQIYQLRLLEGSPGDALSDWLQAERDCSGADRLSGAAAQRARLRGETLLKDPD